MQDTTETELFGVVSDDEEEVRSKRSCTNQIKECMIQEGTPLQQHSLHQTSTLRILLS